MFYNNNNNNNEPIPTVNVVGEAGTKLINYTQESGGKRHFIFEVRAASRGFLFAKEELEESGCRRLRCAWVDYSQIAFGIFVGSGRS